MRSLAAAGEPHHPPTDQGELHSGVVLEFKQSEILESGTTKKQHTVSLEHGIYKMLQDLLPSAALNGYEESLQDMCND